MAVHNGGRFLREAVQSILDQTWKDLEFVVVDDGSTDDTAAVLDGYADRRIVRLRNERNLGLTASLNVGLSAVRGALLARMDADDVSMPHRLETQARFLESRPDVGVLGSAAALIGESGEPRGLYAYPAEHAVIRWRLCFQNPINHPTVMLRTDLLRQVGGYDPDARVSQDYALWQRLAPVTRFANLPEPLVKLRRHGQSVSARRGQEQTENGIRYGRRIMADLLGEDPAEAVVRGIWTGAFQSSRDALLAGRLVADLALAAAAIGSRAEAKAIMSEAHERLRGLRRHCGIVDRCRLVWLRQRVRRLARQGGGAP
jgi:glycosyltransferase involved in cell wall biosynthesis